MAKLNQKIQVNLAATFVIEPFRQSLESWMKKAGLEAKVSCLEYGQLLSSVTMGLNHFAQFDLNIWLIRLDDFFQGPVSVKNIEKNFSDFCRQLGNVNILLLVAPPSESLQQLIVKSKLITKTFDELKQKVKLIHLQDELTRYNIKDYHDPDSNELAHIPYSKDFFEMAAIVATRYLSLHFSKPKKVIVVDADNTLWKGVCAEDNEITIEANHDFLQKFLLQKKKEGFLLCLVSKNNQADIELVFSKNKFLLKKNDFVSIQANWKPKSENLLNLERLLNLSADSFIFIDDNPIECAEVSRALPDVTVINLSEISGSWSESFQHYWCFDLNDSTHEGESRTLFYQQDLLRNESKNQFQSEKEFFDSLQLKINISKSINSEADRLIELALRTNQFNLHPIQTDLAKYKRWIADPQMICLSVKVSDKFGDYGLVGSVVAKIKNNALVVHCIFLSCRVLGRGVEHGLFSQLGKIAREHNLEKVLVLAKNTGRNEPALIFIKSIPDAVIYPLKNEEAYVFDAKALAALVFVPRGGSTIKKAKSPQTVKINRQPDILSFLHRKQAADPTDKSNQVEFLVRQIFQRILGDVQLDASKPLDGFGIDSFDAIDIVLSLQKEFGIKLPKTFLFQYPTIEKICRFFESPKESNVLFVQEDLDLYSGASFERNPIHVGLNKSSQFQSKVVYGALAFFEILRISCDKPSKRVRYISLKFHKPLLVDQEYSVELIKNDEVTLVARIIRGEEIFTVAEVEFESGKCDISSASIEGYCQHAIARHIAPKDLFRNMRFSGNYFPNPDFVRQLALKYRLDKKGLDIGQVAVLLWTSYFVGMEMPGYLGVCHRVQLDFKSQQKTDLLHYSSEIIDVSEEFRVVQTQSQIKVKGQLFANAHVWAGLREEASQSDVPVKVPQKNHIHDIAIVGVGLKFPNADSMDDYWKILSQGINCISKKPEGNIWGGFLKNTDCFDPMFFRISPREAIQMDPQQRLLLEVAWACLEDAGYTSKTLPRETGVYTGVVSSNYRSYAYAETMKGSQVLPLSDTYQLSNRISFFCDLVGPSITISTACSSSLVALMMAIEALRLGKIPMALVSGINLLLHPAQLQQYQNMGMLSPDHVCRPFDENANGTVMGEGAGVILVKPLPDAIRDRDNIHAVIKGGAVGGTGRTHGFSVPSPDAQGQLIKQALEDAKVEPQSVSYIETHGTGTNLGDPIEIRGLEIGYEGHGSCALGSVKGNIGHLESAAGMAGLIKIILQLKHGQLTPTLNSSIVNRDIHFSPDGFHLQSHLAPWPGKSRRAGVSSFGMGGTNAHIILEEFENSPSLASNLPKIFEFSARTSDDLNRLITKYISYFNEYPDLNIRDVAHTLRMGREKFEFKLTVEAASLLELKKLLEDYIEGKRIPLATKAEILADDNGHKISLPTYPFKGQSYWIGKNQPTQLSTDELKTEHCVDSVLLVPASATLQLAASALEKALPLEFSKITWMKPLIDEEPQVRFVQETSEFEIHCADVVYTRGKIRPIQHQSQIVDLEAAVSRCPNVISQFYEECEKKGFIYGDSFRVIKSLRWGLSESVAEIRLVKENNFDFDPWIFDGIFQTAIPFCKKLSLPFFAQKIKVFAKLPKRFFVHTLQKNEFTFDMTVLAETGEVLAAIEGFTVLNKPQDVLLLKPALKQINIAHSEKPADIITCSHLNDLNNQKIKNKSVIIFKPTQDALIDYFHIIQYLMGLNLEISVVTLTLGKGEFGPIEEAIAAFNKCLAQENKKITTKVVMQEPNSRLNITDSLSCDADQLIGGEQCWFSRSFEEVVSQKSSLKPGSVIMITGGSGGLGQQLARYYVAKGCRVALLGRKNINQTNSDDLIHLTANCCDREELKKVYNAIVQKWGTVDLVLHLAAVLDDALLINKSIDRFQNVLNPKVNGVQILSEIIPETVPILLFSSISSFLGNMGQCDYAAANGFMDGFCRSRKNMKSIQWPYWSQGGMIQPDWVNDWMKKKYGLTPMPMSTGFEVFESLLSISEKNIVVLHGDKLRSVFLVEQKRKTTLDKKAWDQAYENIRNHCARVLQVNASELEGDAPWPDFGLDSIMMIELMRLIEEEWDIILEPSVLTENNTLRKLTDYLVKQDLVLSHSAIQNEEVASHQKSESHQAVTSQKFESDKIAIVGLSCRLPQSPSPEVYWENLSNSRDMTSEMPKREWLDDFKIKRGGFVDGIELFDADFFKISPEEARSIDPQQRMILELTQELFDRSGYSADEMVGSKTGIFLGGKENNYVRDRSDRLNEKQASHAIVNMIQNMLANRVSDFYDLHGPSMVIDTACSSSLVAIHQACRSLLNNECEMAIAGGVYLLLDSRDFKNYSDARVLSPDGVSYVFDKRAQGFVLGEGAGLVMLKKLDRAIADGDMILGIILGSAINNDGRTMGLTTPNQKSQQAVIKEALEKSGVTPETISYLEAHGTGTLLGDPIEIKAASDVYRASQNQFCAVGSVKSNMGHLLQAAGIAGFIKILLMMKYRKIAPTLHCESPHPRFQFEASPFYPVQSLTDWKEGNYPRRAAISAFGFGGTNCHMILEEFDKSQYQPIRKMLSTELHRKKYWLEKESVQSGYVYHADDALLKDHTFCNRPVLMGVAHLGLIVDHLRRVEKKEEGTLKRFQFLKGLILDESQSASLTVHRDGSIFTTTDGITEFARCEFQEVPVQSKPDIDIQKIKSEAVSVTDGYDFYERNAKTNFVHGPSLRTLKKIYHLQEGVLGELVLDSLYQKDSFLSHPALFDGAYVLGILATGYNPTQGDNPYVPFLIEKIIWKGNLPSHCFSLTKISKQNDQLFIAEHDLYDASGKWLISLSKFSGMKASPENFGIRQINKGSTLKDNIEAYIVSLISNQLGRKSVDTRKNFMELGVDSLSLVELSKKIEDDVAIELYPTLFFEYQNIPDLCSYFEKEHGAQFGNYLKATPSVLQKIQNQDDDRDGLAITPKTELGSDIAIIGMASRFAGSKNPAELWQHLEAGDDLITEVPKRHWDIGNWYDPRQNVIDKTYCRHGSFIDDVDKFDATFFNVAPVLAQSMDPQLRMLLEVMYETFEDAGCVKNIRGSKTGVFIGCCFTEYWDEIVRHGLPQTGYEHHGSGRCTLPNYPSYFYDLQGPSICIDDACSSSLVALHMACQSLRQGECEKAVVGGVNLILSPLHYVYFSQIHALSPTGHCYAFDKKADGYVPAEGIATVLLKPLAQALKDGDRIHAVIKGSATNHGGKANNATSPRQQLQTRLLIDAWKNAQIDPETLGYIEAHGTGTPLGDPIEFNAIQKAFENFTQKKNFCTLGSLKAHLGHSEATAGIAGIIKLILMMQHQKIPAMPNFTDANPYIKIEASALRINKVLQEWKSIGPRRAGVNSFGMGGAYAHVVLEEGHPQKERKSTDTRFYIPLSAISLKRLVVKVEQLAQYLDTHDVLLEDVAYTLQNAREEFDYKILLMVSSVNELKQKLLSIQDDLPSEESSIPLAYPKVSGGKLIDLPKYPFEKVSYWMDFSRKLEIANVIPYEKNISVGDDIVFYRDHIFGGNNIMPGAVTLEWMRKTLDSVNRLENVYWLNPLIVDDSPLQLRWNESEVSVHREGKVIAKAGYSSHKIQPEKINIEDVKQRCGEHGVDLYKRDESRNVFLGQSLKSVKEYWGSSAELIARIEVPSGDQAIDYHPALVDAAFQCANYFCDEKTVLIPYFAHQIDYCGRFEKKMFVRVSCIEPLSTYGGKFKIEWLDDSGNVLAKISTYEARRMDFRNLSYNEQTNDVVLKAIAEIITDVLKVKSVDSNVNFSKYGFESVSIAQLTRKINERFSLELTPAAFFEHQTLATYSAYVSQQMGSSVADEKKPNASEHSLVSDRKNGIAIIGMSCRFPGSSDYNQYWQHLKNGNDLVTEVPADRLKYLSSNVRGGFIDDIFGFDAEFFGISPREARFMDPQQRHCLELTYHALQDAGYEGMSKSNTGVFIAAAAGDYQEILSKKKIEAHTGTGFAHSILPNRISYFFNFHGPSEVIDTACSSSLVAIHRACQSLLLNECTMAVAGGVNILLTQTLFDAFEKAGMLSPSGHCYTFDERANGYVRGEGAGMLVLKKFDDAVRDGDPIHAVILSSAVNHGGHVNTLTTPNPLAQQEVIEHAHVKAGIDPESIGYVEAHGTGTSLGDPIEINALERVFAKNSRKIMLGSVKANLGHLEVASGMAGVIKAILALKHQIPPQIHFEKTNPFITLNHFKIPTQITEWESSPRRAGVSSFGFGGTNAHIVLEGFSAQSARKRMELKAFHHEQYSVEDPQKSDDVITVMLGSQDPYLTDHRVRMADGKFEAIYPGMWVVALVMNVSKTLPINPIRSISDLYWLRPLRVKKDGPATLQFNLAEGNFVLKFEGQDYCHGKIQFDVVNVESENLRTLTQLKVDDFYEHARKYGVDLGERYRGIKKIGRDNDALTAWVEVKSDGKEWHPGLLDSIPQLFAPLFQNENLYLPYGFKQAIFLRTLPSQVFVQLEKIQITSDFGSFNAWIFDETGNCCVCIKEFLMKPVAIESEIKLFEQKWTVSGKTIKKSDDRKKSILSLVEGVSFRNASQLPIDTQVIIVIPSHEPDDSVIFDEFLHVLQSIDQFSRLEEIWVVAKNLNAVSSGDIINSASARCVGLARVAQMEYPKIKISICDLDSLDDLDFTQVPYQAVRNGLSFVPVWKCCSLDTQVKNAIRKGGVYLIVGGMGGLGFEFARYLAKSYQAKLFLVGRREINSEIQEKIVLLNSLGGEAHYLSADISNFLEIKQVISSIHEQVGKINGVIHAAFNLNDSVISNLNSNTINEVCRPKVEGTQNLLKAIIGADWIAIFSSMVSLAANQGQGAYTAASYFQDAYARVLAQVTHLPIKIINWGPWKDVGSVADSYYHEIFEKQGIVPFTTDEGIDIFEKILQLPHLQIACMKAKHSYWKEKEITSQQIEQREAIPSVIELIKKYQSTAVGIDAIEVLDGMAASLVLGQNWDFPISAKFSRLSEAISQIRKYREFKPINTEAFKTQYPKFVEHYELLVRCVENCRKVMSGEKTGAEIVFDRGGMDKLAAIYSENPLAKNVNAAIAFVAKQAQDLWNKTGKEKIRILELGAGTGATAMAVIKELNRDNLQYVLSDLSPQLLDFSKNRLSEFKNIIQTQVIDVDEMPASGTLYDIVIATNVMHASESIVRSLGHVKKYLKKNGLFILGEITTPSYFFTMTFGLLDGWWKYQDENYREPHSPLLNRLMWEQLLIEQGYRCFIASSNGDARFDQPVFVAQSDGMISDENLRKNEISLDNNTRSSAVVLSDQKTKQVIQEEIAFLLERSPQNISTEKAFSEMGIDSILAIELTNKLNKRLGFEIKTVDLFNYPDVNTLADALENRSAASPKTVAREDDDPIVVVAMSGRFPGADNIDEFWDNLKNGVCSVGPVTHQRWNHAAYYDASELKSGKTNCPNGGFVANAEFFDPLFFQLTPQEAEMMDPQQRLFLEEAWLAVKQANVKGKCGVFAGAIMGDYDRLIQSQGKVPGYYQFMGNSSSILASRISYLLNLSGPAITYDTACSSSLVALHEACESIKRGECDQALVGGVSIYSTPAFYVMTAQAGMLSPSGQCHAFSDDADGFVPGEAVGVIVLKKLSQALKDENFIYGIIRASGVNQDGKTNGMTAPSGNSQFQLEQEVYKRSKISPDSIGMVEAHGTGTRLGDPIEFDALKRSFNSTKKQYCALGSVKTNIGHTGAAAGIVGVIKSLLCLHHQQRVASLHFSKPNGQINFDDSPFFISTQSQFWSSESDRMAAVSSFGFSGTNCHVVLQEYSKQQKPVPQIERPFSPKKYWIAEAQAELEVSADSGILEEIADWLKVSIDDLDVHAPLTDYGCDSIAMTHLSRVFNEKWGWNVSPAELIEFSSIQKICDYLSREYQQTKKIVPEPKRDFESNLSPVAIVGMAGKFPGAENILQYWDNIKNARVSINEIPKERFDWRNISSERIYGGFIDGVDLFDASYFHISPREAVLMDPQQRLMIETVWQALADSGLTPKDVEGTSTGIFVGVSSNDYSELLSHSEIESHQTTGNAHSILANRISYLFDLKGPSEAIDTACSSSLVAIHRAVQSLRSGECRMAIAGGVNVILTPGLFQSFTEAGMLSPSGQCRPFDAKANGYVRGEGVGAVLLKPLDEAIQAGDSIYAVIRGSYVNHNGRTSSLTAPNPEAQSDCIRQAWKNASVHADQVNYIEAHGTGTVLGDPMEFDGFLRAGRQKKTPCFIGSVKGNIGHLEAASGIASFIKVVLMLQNKSWLSLPNLEKINPYLSTQSVFKVIEQNEKWNASGQIAGVSSIGFGGVNAHVVLEEYGDQARQIKVDNPFQRKRYWVSPQSASVAENEGDWTEKIRGILINYLNVDEKLIQPDLTFDVYGLDSIYLVGFVRKLEKLAGCPINPSDVIENPTLKKLAIHLSKMTTGAVVNERKAVVQNIQRVTERNIPIAIIGMACELPGASNVEVLWNNLLSAKSNISPMPKDRMRDDKNRWGGFLDNIYDFDSQYFLMSASEALQLDPLARKFLEIGAQTINDAGYQEMRGKEVGVFVGARASRYGEYLQSYSRNVIAGLGQNFIAARLSHFFDWKGPSLVIDTACSSSLVSIHMACQSIRLGECQLALAGGVDLLIDDTSYRMLETEGALSPDGRCSPFDENANGLVPGEGVGAVLLKRLDDALRDGDRILAVIEGSAVNNDGATMGVTTPNGEAQQNLIWKVVTDLQLPIEDVGYVEAHGTGTMIGDPIELKALTQVYSELTDKKGFCAVGSIKSNIGHLMSAAGIAGFIKTVLILNRGIIPPTLNCTKPNPRFNFDSSPFYPQRTIGSLKSNRAAVSAFGLGGTNCHIVLKKHENRNPVRKPLQNIVFNKMTYRPDVRGDVKNNSEADEALDMFLKVEEA